MRYRPELDGLRALAVAGVLINHAFLPVGTPSGLVGVVAFFVLSGYLITSLLLEEREGTGRVGIRAFYARRVRRLGPGLVILLAFVSVVGLLGLWRVPWLEGVVRSLFYVGNLSQGAQMGPLAQTWTLAVEEQFYLVWPVLVLLGGRRGVLALGCADLAWTFAVRGALSYPDAIVLGALIAALRVNVRPLTAVTGLAVLALLCSVSLPLGLQVSAAAVAAAAVVAGRTPIGFLAPMGKRAYEIYLWDFTLTTLIGPGIGGVAAVGAAELTYRLTAPLRAARHLRLAQEAGIVGSGAAGAAEDGAGAGGDVSPDRVGVRGIGWGQPDLAAERSVDVAVAGR